MARRSAKRRYYKKRYRKKKTWSSRRKYYRSKKWSKGTMPLGNKAEISVPIRWNGQTSIDFQGLELDRVRENSNLYRMNTWSMNFNPMNAMLCNDLEQQRLLQLLDPAVTSPTTKYLEWVINDSSPSDTSQTFYPNHFINQWYSPLFRWYLSNYQEWKVNYVMLKLTPMQATSNSGSYYPFKMCHFVDRKYTGKNGSAVERYMQPGLSAKAGIALIEDINKQGKKWKVFRPTDLANRSYKIYLKASGAQEKTVWYTTEAAQRNWGAFDTNIDPTHGVFVKQMWNDAISPNQMDALRHTQTGFCPEVVVVCMRDYALTASSTITFDWELEVGCSFRAPGKWIDGASGDSNVWNWLNAPLIQLGASKIIAKTDEDPIVPYIDDYHTGEPQYQTGDEYTNRSVETKNMGTADVRINGELVKIRNSRYVGIMDEDIPVIHPSGGETSAPAKKVTIVEAPIDDEEPDDEDEAELEDPGPAKKKKKRR